MSLFDKTKKKKTSAQQFLGIESIEESCAVTIQDRIAYIIVSPCNLSVLPSMIVESMILNFKRTINGLGTAEYMCINSSQSYESNKKHLADLAGQERNFTLKELDLRDIRYLDDIRVKMATNREFLIILRFNKQFPLEQIPHQLHKAIQLLRDNQFSVRPAEKKDYKRLLAIYFEQNIFEEYFQDFDGENYADTILEGSL